jgi:hypothetical protein
LLTNVGITIADEVWVATALLHRENPERADFTATEIEARLRDEAIAGVVREGVRPHIYLHCVANVEPLPARLRMLYETDTGRRRLFRHGDDYSPRREGSTERGGTRVAPEREKLAERYHYLLDWYFAEYSPRPAEPPDPILSLRGLGRALPGGEHPDDYVRRLRQGW